MSGDPVRIAAEAFAQRCLEHLREVCPGTADAKQPGFPRWVEDTGSAGVISRVGDHRIFRLDPDTWQPNRVCALREVSELQQAGIAEYRKLLEALETDSIIGPRLGDEIVGGAGLGGGALQPPAVTTDLVVELVARSGGFEQSYEAIRARVEEWLDALRRKDEQVVVLAPLADVTVARPPIELAEGVVIDELTSEEIGAALAFGSWTVSDFEQPAAFSLGPPTVLIAPTFAVRTSYSAPVVVGGGTHEEVQATITAQEAAALVAQDVLLALRLFKPGRAALRGVVQAIQRPGLQAASASRLPNARSGRAEPYLVGPDDATKVAELYRDMVSARENAVIDAAVRRFGYAADRTRADDEIVDLVIAAESILLSEIGRPRERGELRFRLSTRAAAFTDGANEHRRAVARFMRKAYDVRSGVVHGGELAEGDLRGLTGAPVPVNEFAADLEAVVRDGLQKAVRLQASGDGFPPVWDDLLFP
jgi:hypothetical protein